MTGLNTYSTTPANNVNANTGINWDEGMAPAAVNNSARQNMTDLRLAFNDLIWFQYGKGDLAGAPTYSSGTIFTQASGSDLSAPYHIGRRVKAVGVSTGTIYGTISGTAYAASTQTVTVVWDSGSLSNEALAVYLSQIPVTGSPVPGKAIGGDEASFVPVLKFNNATTGITYGTQVGSYTRFGDTIHYWISIILTSKGSATGNATITGLPTAAAAVACGATFGDALSLTGGLQSKILAAGTTVFLYALGTGVTGALQDTNFTNTSEINVSGSYRV